MDDREYVRELLGRPYDSHRPNEEPYPDLRELIAVTEFDFQSGYVFGQRNNSSDANRDGKIYQSFTAENKRILVHRFITAVAIGKWPPRELEVHHLNSDPEDNRPENLELVTPSENNHQRRAPLKTIIDLDRSEQWMARIPKRLKEPKRRSGELNRQYTDALDQIKAQATKVPDIETVLRRYYVVPKDVVWTGRRKGKDDCYHEATTGIWYYVKPNAPTSTH